MQTVLIRALELYQRTLSPDHGWWRHQHPLGFCRFYPSCSEYAKQSIQLHGAARGSWRALLRLLRCHPWSAGGLDPVSLNK